MGKKVNNLPIDMKIKSEPEGLPPSLFGAAPKGIHFDKASDSGSGNHMKEMNGK